MGLAIERLGRAHGERVDAVDPAAALAYAAATNDDNPAYASGVCAPPVFAVVPTWEAMTEALADVVPPDAMVMIVHGEQDMHFARPLVPGRRLRTRAEAVSVRPSRSGTRCTVRVSSADADTGEPVVEQFVTMFVRGVTGGDGAGPDKPTHDFPSEARERPVGTHTVAVDEDQTLRYRDASGDHNPIHVDDDVARAVGLPGRIVHGLCTMAMVARSVVALTAAGDPTRLRRLAVRFSDTVFPGSEVVTCVYDAGQEGDRRVYAFESESGGRRVVTNGRAEIGP